MADTPISSLAVFVGSLPAGTYVPIITPDGTSSTGFASYRATPDQLDESAATLSGTFVTATDQSSTMANSRLLAAQSNVTTITDAGAGSTITVGIATNGIGNTQLRQGTALSVIGNSTNGTANVADIAAGADHNILRRSGTAIGFGSIDLSQSGAVGSSILAGANGGTGVANTGKTLTLGGNLTTSGSFNSTFTMTGTTGVTFPTSGTLATTAGASIPAVVLGDVLYGSAANTLSALVGNITTDKQYLSQTGNGAVSAAPAWATIAGSDITGAALTKVDDTNVTLTLGGTPATALLRAASITAGWTGQLGLGRGGTAADLSATGGTSQVLRQSSAGAAITVSQLAASDLSNGVTGSGAVVLANTPTLITPALGAATATSIAIGGATLGAHALAVTGTALFNNAITYGGVALSNSVTGTGSMVLSTSPSLTTPSLGVATATSLNGMTFSGAGNLALASGKTITFNSTFTVGGTDGGALVYGAAKTLTVNNSLALAGTDSTVMTFPGATDTVMGLGATQTVTAAKTFSSSMFKLAGATSGTITVNAASVAGTNTITLPAGTTDFSATGGSSQVVKQTSAGGAFTVAQLAASDLSNGTTGTGAVALADSPTFTSMVVMDGWRTGAQVAAGKNSISFNAGIQQALSINETTGAGSGTILLFQVSASTIGSISFTGTTTAYNTTSDVRRKENIVSTARGLADLMRVKIRDFNFKGTKERVQGVIAQEVHEVYPEAVTVGGADHMKSPWGIDYGRLVPLAIKAIQDLCARVELLERKGGAQ